MASGLILSALDVFFDEGVTWVWTPRRGHLRAVLLPRKEAVSLLTSELEDETLTQPSRDELRVLSEVLPGTGDRYVAVATTNLVASKEGEEQIAELDGVAVHCAAKGVSVVISEAKRQMRGATGSAKSALEQKLRVLGVRPGVTLSPVETAQVGRLARASVKLVARV